MHRLLISHRSRLPKQQGLEEIGSCRSCPGPMYLSEDDDAILEDDDSGGNLLEATAAGVDTESIIGAIS